MCVARRNENIIQAIGLSVIRPTFLRRFRLSHNPHFTKLHFCKENSGKTAYFRIVRAVLFNKIEVL